MKKLLAMTVIVGLLAGFSQAALWNTAWSGATYASIDDADVSGGARDIIQLESIYGTDTSGEGYYFRMTLSGTGAKDDSYMLNFDTDNNTSTGGDQFNSTYVGGGVSGIDKIVDAHYNGGPYNGSHYHQYSVGTDPNANYSSVDLTSVGGAFFAASTTSDILEWYVPTALLNPGATVRGSIVDIGLNFGDTETFDVTGGIVAVPEPTGLALLALGAVVIGLRRKIRG